VKTKTRYPYLLATIATLLSSSCIPGSHTSSPTSPPGQSYYRLTDRTGIAVLEIAAREPSGRLETSRVRGPARFRPSPGGNLVAAARVLRPSELGVRRGDLVLRLNLPPGIERLGSFRGAPLGFSVSYLEASPGRPSDAYSGSGRIRLSYRRAPDGDHYAVVVNLRLHRDSPTAGPQAIWIRGVLSTDPLLAENRGEVDDLIVSVGLAPFDPFAGFDRPDLDFEDEVSDAAPGLGDWWLEPADAFLDTFCPFDYGSDLDGCEAPATEGDETDAEIDQLQGEDPGTTNDSPWPAPPGTGDETGGGDSAGTGDPGTGSSASGSSGSEGDTAGSAGSGDASSGGDSSSGGSSGGDQTGDDLTDDDLDSVGPDRGSGSDSGGTDTGSSDSGGYDSGGSDSGGSDSGGGWD
jgi:uncharacterized membrane protein YgcG